MGVVVLGRQREQSQGKVLHIDGRGQETARSGNRPLACAGRRNRPCAGRVRGVSRGRKKCDYHDSSAAAITILSWPRNSTPICGMKSMTTSRKDFLRRKRPAAPTSRWETLHEFVKTFGHGVRSVRWNACFA